MDVKHSLAWFPGPCLQLDLNLYIRQIDRKYAGVTQRESGKSLHFSPCSVFICVASSTLFILPQMYSLSLLNHRQLVYNNCSYSVSFLLCFVSLYLLVSWARVSSIRTFDFVQLAGKRG